MDIKLNKDTTQASGKNNQSGKKVDKQENKVSSQKVGKVFFIVVLLVLGFVFALWLGIEPKVPPELMAEVNEQEISNAVGVVKSIDETTSLENEVKQSVNNMLNPLLRYDNGKTIRSNGYVVYNYPDPALMGVLQRALTGASEEKIKVIQELKTPDESLESKIITSSGQPISKILIPALSKRVKSAVLNIYMNNGDPPVSLAVDNEFLKVIGIAQFATYFLDYVGTEKRVNVWLDDEYIQQFVDTMVPTFYDMMSYPYKAAGKEVPENIKESIALRLCESWDGITPLTRIDMCRKNVEQNTGEEDVREGS